MISELKYRHEYKYIISEAQIHSIQERIKPVMTLDKHVGCRGKYTISSLYFDTYSNRNYYDNESGVDPREKFRIRIYDHNMSHISLECKRKECGKTLKKSCLLSYEDTANIINGSADLKAVSGLDLLNKFLFQVYGEGLHPVVIVEYERIPYVYRYGNVRVTFDMNVSSISDVNCFLEGADSKNVRPIMPIGKHLMEVKFDEFLPDYIYRAIQMEGLERTAYSKYYLCRKFSY